MRQRSKDSGKVMMTKNTDRTVKTQEQHPNLCSFDESIDDKDSSEEISVLPSKTTEAIVEFLTLDDESDLDEDFYIIERCDELGQMPVDDDTPVNDDVR